MRTRLEDIEKKLDRVIVLLEGTYGSDGLVREVKDLKVGLSEVRKFTYKVLGAIAVLTPFATLLLKHYIA